jgi:tight adherence protein B
MALRHRRLAGVLVGLPAVLVAAPLGGPVAAALAGTYANLGLVALRRHHQVRAALSAESAALDAVGGLAADLRAGMSPTVAFSHALPALESSTVDGVRRLARRVGTAGQVADLAGVPLADLLDRLEADARGLRQVATMAAAQAAGTRATAWLLAALPAAGIALGYGMGTDPLQVLLHTPLGAACSALAAVFQLTGLAWSARLARSVAEVH